jgi:ABC-type phosphate transport system auxiliary subunit
VLLPPLSQDPQQCSAEVAALRLQNETLVAQQRIEIAAVRSDCEARKQRWKSEVHELRSKIRSLQAEMQTKCESTRDDGQQTSTDLSLINHFSDAIPSELLRQRRLYSLTSFVPSAELPIK